MSGPHFLGIGAHKSGTTWLHGMLASHPEIGLPARKELHFWDKRWPAIDPNQYDAQFTNMAQPIRGEITPAYAVLPRETIGFIRQRYPRLRLLYVMRNPIDRAWSHARSGFARCFPEVPISEIERHLDWFLSHINSPGSLGRGDYVRCLENWLQHYPSESLLTTLYDDLRSDPRAFLRTCYAHLGANPSSADGLPLTMLETRAYPEVVLMKGGRSPLPETVPAFLVPRLLALYRNRISSLSLILGRDLESLWLEPYRS